MATLLRGRNGEPGPEEDVEADAASSPPDAPLFRGLSGEELDGLMAASASVRVSKHQVVFCAGETLTDLYVPRTGSFKLVRHSEEGKELIVALAHPGGCFGALAEPVESKALAQALEDSMLLVVPVTAVRHTLAQNPEFAVRLLQLAERRHESSETTAARLAFETVPQRLAHVLLDVSSPHSGELETPLTQTEIANLIGSSRETVCSLLNQFRRRGLLSSHRGRVRILDRELLGRVK